MTLVLGALVLNVCEIAKSLSIYNLLQLYEGWSKGSGNWISKKLPGSLPCLLARLSVQWTLDVLLCVKTAALQIEFHFADLEEVTVKKVLQMVSKQTLVWPKNPCHFSALCDGPHRTSDIGSLQLENKFRMADYWKLTFALYTSLRFIVNPFGHSRTCREQTDSRSYSNLNHMILMFMVRFPDSFDHMSYNMNNICYLVFRDNQSFSSHCVLFNKMRALSCDCKSAPPV